MAAQIMRIWKQRSAENMKKWKVKIKKSSKKTGRIEKNATLLAKKNKLKIFQVDIGLQNLFDGIW